jgi:hypothetical protein
MCIAIEPIARRAAFSDENLTLKITCTQVLLKVL